LLTTTALNRNQRFLLDFSMQGARAALSYPLAAPTLPGGIRLDTARSPGNSALVAERWF
jgi:hypothetical protein